ncbi:MAG TPA: fumarylacetoacetase [Euzebyales bacterium]|nr:fumarylacetoacetase [Euzebyales bacterium]
MTSWASVAEGSGFPLDHLPYCVFSSDGAPARVGVGIGDNVLDLAVTLDDPVFAAPSLNPFMAQGPQRWRAVRSRLAAVLADPRPDDAVRFALVPVEDVALHLPFDVADYVDFYASLDHATNVGRMFRPDDTPLKPNWRHLPVGYHGRAGTVVVSGTPIVRPRGQFRVPGEASPSFGPSRRLDIEAEVGFVVGTPSRLGHPLAVDDLAAHVFGVVLVNDWSARDIQAWEYVPLGPFLGKSFATSISPWVVPLEALDAAWAPPPPRDPKPLPYLRGAADRGLDLTLEVRLNDHVVSHPPFATMYWTPAQQLAHMTVNGATVRTGDLFASGTVSGPDHAQRGSLLELTWNATEPLTLPDGTTRTFLEDGDTVTISATAPGVGGARVSLGAVTGTVVPARGAR